MIDADGMRVAALLKDSLSIREVAAETGLSKVDGASPQAPHGGGGGRAGG
jgi:hypothetical protein